MGLLDGITHQSYYEGSNLGSYQFTSLEDIINQFMIAYVGEGKIVSKARKTDVAFHAQRAMQELSFDTFKSIKSQQIDVPASLTMKLPHDYVNYAKISSVDSAGIKHLLYPTNSTSNPFQINQDENGEYEFPAMGNEEVVMGDFVGFTYQNPYWKNNITQFNPSGDKITFRHRTFTGYGGVPTYWGKSVILYQELDVSEQTYVNLSADGIAADMTNGEGVLRVGLTTSVPDLNVNNFDSSTTGFAPTTNSKIDMFDLSTYNGDASYLEWRTTTDNTLSKELAGINVTNYDTIWVVLVSFHEFTAVSATVTNTNIVDNVSVIGQAKSYLQEEPGNESESSTWNSYKSATPSENQDDYQDDIYWPNNQKRYGLDPQHAQVNGSFYIDNLRGNIHFSSNISSKTVILDYISDSLGTDGEMQVHKFAEEAMYKWIMYAVLSTRANTPEYIVQRYKKEKFAATRQAKLRLSNIKLEELTQILRGKSKHIKH